MQVAVLSEEDATVRCFACRNRIGLVAAVVLGSGVVVCRRCVGGPRGEGSVYARVRR